MFMRAGWVSVGEGEKMEGGALINRKFVRGAQFNSARRGTVSHYGSPLAPSRAIKRIGGKRRFADHFTNAWMTISIGYYP